MALEDWTELTRGDILRHTYDRRGRAYVSSSVGLKEAILAADLLPAFRKILLEQVDSMERQTRETRGARQKHRRSSSARQAS